MLGKVDRVLNSFTMYRVVLYGLLALFLASLALSLLGFLPYSVIELIVPASILVLGCYFLNLLLSRVFKTIPNSESSIITALILFFALPPGYSQSHITVFVIAAITSMSSKYLLAINRKHIFNPAAFALLFLSATGLGGAGWWVSSPYLFPLLLIVGLLVVRKVRRFTLVGSFIAASIFVHFLVTKKMLGLPDLQTNLFFMTVMLTEPLTSPTSKSLQITFGSIVGALFSLPFSIGPLFSSPEVALIVGNIFNFFVSPKQKVFLALKEKVKLGKDIWEFSFSPDRQLHFKPGQYVEWTIKNQHNDTRGNRRYFTIASSPTENDIKLVVKVPQNTTAFKKSLLNLEKGKQLLASYLAGEFVLPKDISQKLVFIAGGVGITPIRSIVKYLIDTKAKRDIVLFYIAGMADEFVYKDLFREGEVIGVKTVFIETNKSGHLSKEDIEKATPDYLERKFYLSGPPGMVESYKKLIKGMGVKPKNIVTDLFIGY